MLSRFRARLRQIRYYSAARHDTPWHRASDRVLWIALLLALPTTWLSTVAVRPPGLPEVVEGRFGLRPDGSLTAWLAEREHDRPHPRIAGTFGLSMVERTRGWPFVTRVACDAPELAVDVFSEPSPRSNVQLRRDDPMWRAIEVALREGGSKTMHAAWRDGDLPARTVWIGWLTGTLVWWVILSLLGTSAVWLLAYLWRIRRGRHARREAERVSSGRCASCGYDMRGLEFNERCPECGTRT